MQCNDVKSMVDDPLIIQVEKIAESFARVSQEYEPLQKEDIDINEARNLKPVPWITSEKINGKIQKIKSGVCPGNLSKSSLLVYHCL